MDCNYNIAFYNKQNSTWDPARCHETLEILLSMSEGGHFFLAGQTHRLQIGTLCLISTGTLHRLLPGAEPPEFYTVHYPPETLHGLATAQTDFVGRLLGVNRCVNLAQKQMEQLIWWMENFLRQTMTGFGSDIRRNILFMELLITVCEIMEERKLSPAPLHEDYEKISPVISYVDEHLPDPISLDVLARASALNKYYLCHLFKEITGFTLVEYISHRRVLLACQMLEEGECVQKTGERCGFANNAHFIRTFGKFTGITPGQYGRAHRYNNGN